jgi:isopenicillin-N epimerase
VNIIARSLVGYSGSYMQRGDEILTTDQEYGACDQTWTYLCNKAGVIYKHQSIPLPILSAEQFIEQFWEGVTNRTKVIYISHITSPTALQFPIEAICQRARQSNILTVIDGAHAPGQIPIDLEAIGADFYIGNCHKWMMAPKGSGFLHTKRERQALVEPLIVSSGYAADENNTSGSRYLDLLEFTGTRDPAAVLSVPAAIQFQIDHDWSRVRAECHGLLREARQRIEDLTGLSSICPDTPEWYAQMAAFPLPACDAPTVKNILYDQYSVEVPVLTWNGRQFVRVSVQGYNDMRDIEMLLTGLKVALLQ